MLFKPLLLLQCHTCFSTDVFSINFMGVFASFWVCSLSAAATPPSLVVSLCTMWWLSQRKQLTAPGPSLVQAGPGSECLGASRIATSKALVVLRINMISSGNGAACSNTKHSDTHMHNMQTDLDNVQLACVGTNNIYSL